MTELKICPNCGAELKGNDVVYEVVCTKRYLDVGLLVEETKELKPKRVLARAATYSPRCGEYGGVEHCQWVGTGVFLSVSEWRKITYNKRTDQILSELGIKK